MYVQQWQDEDSQDGQVVCGVRVDSVAVGSKVKRVIISTVLLGGIEIGECPAAMAQLPRAALSRARRTCSFYFPTCSLLLAR